MKRAVKLDEEATVLLSEVRAKVLQIDPEQSAEWYNIIKIALKEYLRRRVD